MPFIALDPQGERIGDTVFETREAAAGACQDAAREDNADEAAAALYTVRSVVALTIELLIDGDSDDAYHVVDGLLDNGHVQDAINDHDFDDCGPLRVVSAVVR